jgi:O-antigen/teichoic acid export membrane protein
MVAEHFHAGNPRKAQAVTTMCSWAGFAASLVIFIGFILFGPLVLSLFGDAYVDGQAILLILSAGFLVEAATGPSKIVMMMTGHERAYVLVVGVVTVVGIALTIVLLPVFGLVGAAGASCAARVVSQVAIAAWCRRVIGIDTSILSGLGTALRPAAGAGRP